MNSSLCESGGGEVRVEIEPAGCLMTFPPNLPSLRRGQVSSSLCEAGGGGVGVLSADKDTRSTKLMRI